MRAALAVLLALAGCFKPAPQEGFACGPSGWCPDPLRCTSDGTCRRSDPGSDAAVTIDDGRGTRIDADPSQANIAFVMSTPLTAKAVGGPAAADAMCTAFANAHGHAGTYIAWVSTTTSNARDRLGTARGWVRTDGRPFADRVADLVAGTIYYPLRKNEQGGDTVLPVMTGTSIDGVGNGEDCMGYTSSLDADLMSGGASDGGTTAWTQDAELGCTQLFGVYCLGIDHDFQLAAPTEQGPIAFLSDATFTPGAAGIGSADALCQGEAAAAGVSGLFYALLATTSGSALSRFMPLPTKPWVRRDGVATTRDFATWDAPIDLTASKHYVDDLVFSGATSPAVQPTSGADNCNNWTTSTGSSRVGNSAHAGPQAFGANPGSCGPHRIICLQH